MTDTLSRSTTETSKDGSSRFMAPWPLSLGDARLIAAVAAALLSVTVAAGFVIKELSGSLFGRLDARVNEWFESARTATYNTLTDWGSALSDTITIVIALAVLLPLLAVVTRRWAPPVLLAGSVALETFIFVTASLIVGRDRPPVEQLDASPPTASFPSGHTGAAFAFYLALLVLVFRWTGNRIVRAVALVLLGLAPLAVAVSRLYRGMHYPTDVAFGALIGLVSVALFSHVVPVRPNDEAESERP